MNTVSFIFSQMSYTLGFRDDFAYKAGDLKVKREDKEIAAILLSVDDAPAL